MQTVVTIKQEITDATSLFTDTDVFGETMTLYPEGDPNATSQTFSAVFDRDALPGTNETRGDGRIMENNVERRERASGIIDGIPIAQKANFQTQQDPARPDIIKAADGSFWAVKRMMGEDPDAFSVLVVAGRKPLATYKRGRQG